MSIWVKIFENFLYARRFPKISILVKFLKISILVKFRKNSILVKIYEKFRCFRKFRNNSSWGQCSKKKLIKTVNFDLGHFFWNNCDFRQNFRKVWNRVKFSKNFDIGQNFGKISIFSKISKNFDFFKNFEKFRFW